MRPSAKDFSKYLQLQVGVRSHPLHKLPWIKFKPTREVWPSLRRISGNFKMLNRITWIFTVPIPTKLKNKCEKCVWKFIYSCKKRMALTQPVLSELVYTYDIFLDICRRGFHPNSKKNLEIGRKFMYALKSYIASIAQIFTKLKIAEQML